MEGRLLVKRLLSVNSFAATTRGLRGFSAAAQNAAVYPQFSHARTASDFSGGRDAGVTAAAISFVPESDFIFRHSYNHGPFSLFKTGRLSGLYRSDPRQENVVIRLQELHDRLDSGHAADGPGSGLTVVDSVRGSGKMQGKSNWFSGIVGLMKNGGQQNGAVPLRKRSAMQPMTGAVQGLYLHGGVGVGKTMLMDMFVETKPSQIKVTRAHFHDFMLSIHGRLKEQADRQDPLGFVADAIAAEARVLALDEFFVNDVADAMILNRLFKTLWDREMVLIATSNRKPDDLYLGGLQRDLFLPFIDNLKEQCVVHDMESEVDYRKLAQHSKGVFFAGENRNRCLESAFEQKTAGLEKKRNTQIALRMGRKLHVPLSAGPHCYFTFDELCGKPVGSADYLGLCREFHTVFIQDIPIIQEFNKSAAYRLVTLIDILYDNRVRVLCSAEGSVHKLFHQVISHAESVHGSEGQWVVDDQLSFAKDRSISRMIEMESTEYLLDHANRHAPELLLALAEAEAKNHKVRKTNGHEATL